jgi:predicted nucleic acid-binding protein
MIFVDTNVPMYLIGAEHPHKTDAQRLLERAVTDREPLVTDAEVFQEILHRYTAIDRRDAIEPAFTLLRSLVSEVFAIDVTVVERAKTIVLGQPDLSARDAVHVATMQLQGVERMLSFDSGFDRVPGIMRLNAR